MVAVVVQVDAGAAAIRVPGGTSALGLTTTTSPSRFGHASAQGKNPGWFTKVGDCEMEFNWFLYDYDRGIYDLGQYQYLSSVISHFRGAFGYKGQVANSGMSSSARPCLASTSMVCASTVMRVRIFS